jgi:hypothetical protein
MAGKVVPPALGADSFSCPHCGALAHQTWYRSLGDELDGDRRPSMPDIRLIERVEAHDELPAEAKRNWINDIRRQLAKEAYWTDMGQPIYINSLLTNVTVSQCSCRKLAIWLADGLLYPTQGVLFEPHEDMPSDVKVDFLEAALIVDFSHRGAAALLRLAIQKLMKSLHQSGTNLNADIGALVRKGLDIKVQQALDAVRVIGNHSVHPGTIDLKDDKATAISLFGLINYIVENQIGAPKGIDAIYGKLPPAAIAAIEKRDGIKIPSTPDDG